MSTNDIKNMWEQVQEHWLPLLIIGYAVYHTFAFFKKSYEGFKSFVGNEVQEKLEASFKHHEKREEESIRKAMKEHVDMYHPRRAVPRRPAAKV